MSDRESALVSYLESLVAHGNRQALAELRRGLSGAPGRLPGLYRYVGRFLAEGETRWSEQRLLLVASLFALYHQGSEAVSKSPQQGFGVSFRQLYEKTDRRPSVERRFLALLACHPDSLTDHLRHAVALLHSERIDVNWVQLLSDLRYWSHPDQLVQRRWARQFFRNEVPDKVERPAASEQERIPMESEK